MRTEKGKVTYFRKIHYFSDKDKVRIFTSGYGEGNWRVLSQTYIEIFETLIHSYDLNVKEYLYMYLYLLKKAAKIYKIELKILIDGLKHIYDKVSIGESEDPDDYFTV